MPCALRVENLSSSVLNAYVAQSESTWCALREAEVSSQGALSAQRRSLSLINPRVQGRWAGHCVGQLRGVIGAGLTVCAGEGRKAGVDKHLREFLPVRVCGYDEFVIFWPTAVSLFVRIPGAACRRLRGVPCPRTLGPHCGGANSGDGDDGEERQRGVTRGRVVACQCGKDTGA